MSKEAHLVRTISLCLLLIGSLFAISGCAENNSAYQLEEFVQKHPSPVAGVPYRVYPPDVIGFSSKYVRELDNKIRKVRPDGKVNLPLVGEVFVAGKTVQEIGYEVASRARRYYKRVDVTVYMVRYNSQKIYVFGQVTHPGPLAWTGSDTVLEVLARVQPTLLAWPEKIKIIRAGSPRRGGYLPENISDLKANGAKELTVNMKEMVEKGDMSHNILLKPGDIVFVPPNPSAKIGLALRQLLFPVQPIVEAAHVPVAIDDAIDVFDDDDDCHHHCDD